MKYQKMFQKLVCLLLIWNVFLTGTVIFQYTQKQTEKLNEQICTLEEIPQYELVEIEQ